MDSYATEVPETLPFDPIMPKSLRIRHWKSAWVAKIFAEWERVISKPGWNPKAVHLEGDLYMIDLWGHPAIPRKTACSLAALGLTWREYPVADVSTPEGIVVAEINDHPFLHKLPSTAPRSVKSLYTKAVRMRHLRSLDGVGLLGDLERAENDWAEYYRNIGAMRVKENG